MRLAHIIMAHKNPDQLLRLVKKLKHEHSDIFIHLDKKIPLEPFKRATKGQDVKFIKHRKRCNWGGNSFLVAIVSSLNEVQNSGTQYDYINLISAQDYPLQSADRIYEFLASQTGTNFISFEAAKDAHWWREAKSRYEKYHFTDFNFKFKYLLQSITNTITPRRTIPQSFELYGGSKSSWWTITGACAAYLTSQLKEGEAFYKSLKYSWGTDEFAVATVIMNSPFKAQTVNDNLRYIDWAEGEAHPNILRYEDYNKIRDSGMMFARKFDIEIDTSILDALDHHMDSIPIS